MEQIEFWAATAKTCFGLGLLGVFFSIFIIILADSRTYLIIIWAAVVIALFIAAFFSAYKRDILISQNLVNLGCIYVGRGIKGPPHVEPKKYYKCQNGIIRSN